MLFHDISGIVYVIQKGLFRRPGQRRKEAPRSPSDKGWCSTGALHRSVPVGQRKALAEIQHFMPEFGSLLPCHFDS